MVVIVILPSGRVCVGTSEDWRWREDTVTCSVDKLPRVANIVHQGGSAPSIPATLLFPTHLATPLTAAENTRDVVDFDGYVERGCDRELRDELYIELTIP